MNVREIQSRTILSTSKVYDYAVNPYVGCQHACSYCYARFMKRFSGHKEPWGGFVDVKVNAADRLQSEIVRRKRGEVWVSGVCDPYQPLEARYELTRKCLEILTRHDWPVIIQTRSPLVLRDMDVLRQTKYLEVGLTITTEDDEIRKLFEPHAPPIGARLETLDALHRSGIRTYAMIAPMLPGAEGLAEALAGKVDRIIVDRMNYHHADWVYRKHGLADKLSEGYFQRTARVIASESRKLGMDCQVAF
jgi:DNA repair photolyase